MSMHDLFDAIAHVISHHSSTSSPAAVQSASATLHSLLSSVDDYRPLVDSKCKIVYALVDILHSHSSSPPRTIKDTLKSLFAIALHPLNRPSMINLIVVPAHFSLVVKDGRVSIVEDSTTVIAQVAACNDAVLADPLNLSTASSMRTKENVVSALLNLVRSSGEDVVTFDALDRIVVQISEEWLLPESIASRLPSLIECAPCGNPDPILKDGHKDTAI
ncbi:hypothetical protein Fmac_019589 [Flemingia macrophylla]|uniref:Uncharacterized protein n=1 Tax=Flemingia macrophylla TaxID=520843 RepID=A0ABD1M883_9FABA